MKIITWNLSWPRSAIICDKRNCIVSLKWDRDLKILMHKSFDKSEQFQAFNFFSWKVGQQKPAKANCRLVLICLSFTGTPELASYLHSAAKQQISWVVSLWRLSITFVWPRGSKKLLTTAPSTRLECHLALLFYLTPCWSPLVFWNIHFGIHFKLG